MYSPQALIAVSVNVTVTMIILKQRTKNLKFFVLCNSYAEGEGTVFVTRYSTGHENRPLTLGLVYVNVIAQVENFRTVQ